MGEITFQIIFIVFLLIANGVFSMSEMAVVSARKARLQKRANDGEKGAQAALELAGDPGSFLSTVQIGITAKSEYELLRYFHTLDVTTR
jgi:putative hemolysin